jgi:hypothetical protein
MKGFKIPVLSKPMVKRPLPSSISVNGFLSITEPTAQFKRIPQPAKPSPYRKPKNFTPTKNNIIAIKPRA